MKLPDPKQIAKNAPKVEKILEKTAEDERLLHQLISRYVERPSAKRQWRTKRKIYGTTGRTPKPKKHPMRWYDLTDREDAHAWAKKQYGEKYDPAAADEVWKKARLEKGLPIYEQVDALRPV